MPKFAANIDWMFLEFPFLERFEAAARAGFSAVEFLSPYSHPAESIAKLLRQNGLTNVLFNLPAGDWATGERGIAALPGREAEFRDSVDLALAYSAVLGNRLLHVLSGIVPAELERARCLDLYIDNLTYAAEKASQQKLTLLVEAINPIDLPNYLVQSQAQSFAICEAVGLANVRMQIDLYHMAMTEGELADGLRRYLHACRHIQIAGAPGRHEPDTGDIDYLHLFDLLDRLGYNGWVGCEYKPAGRTQDGLDWYGAQLLRQPR